MGATATTINPSDFANRAQTYFNPKLLEATDFNLVLSAYGMSKPYPAKGTTIRFFRPRGANKSYVGALSENVTTTNKTEVAVGYVDVALAQRGGLAEVTDIVQATDLLDTIRFYVPTMGSDAALDFDTVCRDALFAGLLNSNVLYKYGPTATQQAYLERFAGIANSGNSAVDFVALKALAPGNSKLNRVRHLTMVTQMKAARIPKIGGKYVAVVAPAVMQDVRQDADWVAAATQVNNAALYKNAEIQLDGAVFVEHDNSMIEDETYGTYDDADDNNSGLIYGSIYLGKDAFGIPTLTNKRAGGSQMGPRITILAQPDKSDPQNLKTTLAWKAYYGCKPLITSVSGEVPRYGILRTKSTFA